MAKARVNIPVAAIMREVDKWKDQIVDAIADDLLREAETKAAGAFGDVTGNLRKSIEKRVDGSGVEVGAYAPHAHLIEFGHNVKVRKDGPVIGHAPAHPFLGPAEKATTGRIGQIVNNVVGPLNIEVKE